MLTELGISFFIGIIVGAYLKGLFKKKDKELDVEQAIQLLKDKGYWVKINVNPNDKV